MPLKLLDNYDLSSQVIILTGATDGIGKEMARILSKFNPKRLIIPVRNTKKGDDLLEYIKSSNGHTNNVEIWEMDLADLQSVKNFANKFINEVGELHMLFNNAGFMTAARDLTNDNLELQFQVNHLAPYLLTKLLLDTMKKSVSAELPGKIVFTNSNGHYFGVIDFDNLNLEKGTYWNPFKAYGNAKLMNTMINKEFGRILQNENIQTYSIHPGVIKSGMKNKSDSFANLLLTVTMAFGGSAEQGAINVLYPVLSPDNKETGKYYDCGIEKKPNNLLDDEELVKKVWNVTEQILKDHGMI